MLCCRPKCRNPRYPPWYLCEDCLLAWVAIEMARDDMRHNRPRVIIIPKLPHIPEKADAKAAKRG